MRNIAIVWFRNDLRIHDNEALSEAYASNDVVIPVYIFDPRVFKSKTSFGFEKTGKHRCRFIIESVEDLRNNLRQRGSELYVREGKPEEVLFDLANDLKTRSIYCNRERTSEEVAVQDTLERKLWTIGQEMRYNRGKMLYYTSDLPFPIAQTPDIFTTFRKEVEKIVPIREPLEIPALIGSKEMEGLDPGKIPTLTDLGFENTEYKGPFKGGETAGLNQLHYFIWEKALIKDYVNTRNQMLGWDFSSKFSAWLAQGCLSPKLIYHEIKKFEAANAKNKSTYWLIFELLWRDFFRLMGKKHGNEIFKISGTKQDRDLLPDWSEDRSVFRIWSEARTGVPLIDANMRELNETGFMSNRGRQNVASFLFKDLKINWLMGAEYFESLLLDYDPCSNYGNWNYIVGVGSDPREDRYFNPLSQSRKYDSDGSYIKSWIPELNALPCTYVHSPWALSDEDLSEMGITLGKHYPKPVVDTSKW